MQNLISDEIKSRIAAGNSCFYSPRQMFRSRVIGKAVKIKIHKTMVKTVVVFGSDSWAVAERAVTRLGTWERKILRMIYGPMAQQGKWRIRIILEQTELYKDLDIVAGIRKKRLEWTGHVVRMMREGQWNGLDM